MGTVTWYLTPMTRTSGSTETWTLDTANTQQYLVFFGTQADFDAMPPATQDNYDIVIIDNNGDDLVGSAELRTALNQANADGNLPASMLPSNNSGYLGTSDTDYDAHGTEATGAYSTSGQGIESSTSAVMISLHEPTDTTITADPGYKGGIGNFDPFFPGSLTTDPVCFVTGTEIDTPEGPRRVETLTSGDLVLTADRGAVPLRLVLSVRLTTAALSDRPDLRPIRIRAGALGQDLPTSDLLVSPQHRMLVRSRIAQRMFGTDEVLAAAKQLMQIDGIDIATDLTEFRYYHLVFDQHEIVRSNGTLSESLFPGPEALRRIGRSAREEVYGLFPHLREIEPESVTAARIAISGRQARKLAVRHLQNGKPLLN